MRTQLITLLCVVCLAIFGFTYSELSITDTPNLDNSTLRGKPFNNITLEASLKPFKKNDKAYIQQVATELFTQWSSLLRHTDTVSVMLWTSDGSEILDYKGKLNQPLEWARYIGNPNTEHEVGSGPKELSLHERAYLYMENPPAFTYGDLKFIIQTLKETGKRITGKPIMIGATFDPGPEFAKSEFKYKKHPEILGGNAMGHKTMVSCYSTLNADTDAYAGFPKGIPANTPFGTFLGRQSQHFLTDLGYDFIWLSNGFGFGVEGWSSTGAIFNGKAFAPEKLANTKALIAGFWNLFRKECPGFQIQTRGTNLSTGADLARDGVDLKQIYNGKYNMLPPPNSPWAALDGDFGLEMVGYMSRMAELPDERYLFRYYTHDPWWVNSPWLDRYGQEPHDIYLPMSVARINAKGEIRLPTHLNFLTADNSYGEMPAQVPDEVTPHILKARYDSPTAPGPLVWVYPFDEYHSWAYKQPERLPEIYYGDWLIRQAINNGFPLNTITSTGSLQKILATKPAFFNESILVSIVPEANSSLEKTLIDFVQNGGKLLIYGPADHAGPAFLNLLNLQNTTALDGEFQVNSSITLDELTKKQPNKIVHSALFSGGGIATLVKNKADVGTKVLAKMSQANNERDVVWVREKPEWKGGKVAYVRGTNSSRFTGGKLLAPDDPEQLFTGPLLMRYVLNQFGLDYRIDKRNPSVKNPVLTISRGSNGFFFSGYCPNTTITHRFKLPQGAPILTGYETELADGHSVYNMPKAWHRESRIFVDQADGIVSCQEMTSGVKHMNRCLRLTGLKNATVRIYPDDSITDADLHVYSNTSYPWKKGQTAFKPGDTKFGKHYVVENVTGDLVAFW
ncbi:hypothetical protein [Spirosoma endophyticum]|uniref:Beta-galactosidase trimerisation domain-containing protein n=1 Tax=Spirosoma endophyticum TaxID=662367 RepID=A0A1I1R8B5_9BACT|nr:hypothetical protein [Spirosoma endophyticum]SFD30555.1 hypothetical protein SAMN05216167_104292 [Spirosoma endophyticum]